MLWLGCHKGGGPIQFVMNMEECSFEQACKTLASKFNIDLSQNYDYSKIVNRLNKEKENYSDQIKLSHFLNYVSIDPKNKKRVEHATKVLLTKNNYTPEEFLRRLLSSNTSYDCTSELEGYKEYFSSFDNNDVANKYVLSRKLQCEAFYSKRPTFPFLELTGRVQFPLILYPNIPVGVSARALDDNPLKYITMIGFDISKSIFLYNLNNAYQHIISQGFVIIVEGIMDALRLDLLGFKNVVAPLGTILSDFHIKFLQILTNNFVLFFDGDNAGLEATEKTYLRLTQKNANIRVISCPNDLDPDTFGLLYPELVKNIL